MSELKRVLIQNIKKYRKQLGLSQAALAEKLQISVDSINKIESGQRYPRHETLEKMLKLFKIRPYQLFVEDDNLFKREAYIKKVLPQITDAISDILSNN
ncbi:helix-turn-helix domain-containing protein [Brucepastera parasyntrophica]|uniref:helix-turn-helix domain-containing protein n=1 Tax=Brucepastera parasyntrophica TaxID=2880008 RepID=UPI00210D9D16|nr:helix-turn-helix transcriptional regulator [Brucepastera parasyntrophica]ULQ58535.1 helix-turn-helix domain-containing protein [Brucepastera parasyntrophica]